MEVVNARWHHAIDERGFVVSAKTVHHPLQHPGGVHRKITHMQSQILGERTLS